MDMEKREKEKREKELRNQRFDRGELGALLKLFSSLGITVAFGIVGFFLLGLYVDRKLVELGYNTRGAPKLVFLLLGLGLSIYWAYMRIARHLQKYDKTSDKEDDSIHNS